MSKQLTEEISRLEAMVRGLKTDLLAEKAERQELQNTLWRLEGFELDVSTLDKEMLFDWIKQNWDRMRLEDLKNIYT